jgi:uncharacterized protein (UPF0332 family)
MEPWQQWQAMATESQRAALGAETSACWRSSVSRHYYAAYQAVTSVLLYSGLNPPEAREAWNHADTPVLLETHFEKYIAARDRRRKLRRQLSELYKLRILADYVGEDGLEKRIGEARKSGVYIAKVAAEILPARKHDV